jgi:glycosyltransferase involved in cell wall biosynthesis
MASVSKLPVSTIIPSYNHEKYIGEAIESVLEQSKPPSEIIVVDDCSTDKSRKVLQKYSKHLQVIEHTKNLGGSAALNTGINCSSEFYVSILNSDDTWEADKLEKQLDFMDSENLDVSFTRANIIDLDTKIIKNPPTFFSVFNLEEPIGGSFLNHFFYRGNFLCHPSILAKREMYLQFGLYQKGFEQLPDFAKWIDFAKGGQIGIHSEKLTNYRYLPGKNASSQQVLNNQIRTRNELYLIFSTFFDGLEKSKILNLFSSEISNLDSAGRELAEIDPGTALLMNHPEVSLADQALLAGIYRIWGNSNSLTTADQELIRSLLGKLEISIRISSTTDSPEIRRISSDLKDIAKRILRRLGHFN